MGCVGLDRSTSLFRMKLVVDWLQLCSHDVEVTMNGLSLTSTLLRYQVVASKDNAQVSVGQTN